MALIDVAPVMNVLCSKYFFMTEEKREEKKEQLWRLAKERAGFKSHLMVYLIINGGLWLMWLVSGGVDIYPWPVWPTIGWGIAVVINYFSVYHFSDTAEREYERLTRHQ